MRARFLPLSCIDLWRASASSLSATSSVRVSSRPSGPYASRAHSGSSASDRKRVSVPVVPISSKFFFRSIEHYKTFRTNKAHRLSWRFSVLKMTCWMTLQFQNCTADFDTITWDSYLMSLQHIQAKQHVHWLVLQDGERTREEVTLYLDLSYTSATRQHKLITQSLTGYFAV